MAHKKSSSKPLTYANLDELDKEADIVIQLPKNGSKKANLEKLAKTLKKLDDTLKLYLHGDDEETAYIYAMRFLSAFQTIYSSREFMSNDKWFEKLSVPMEVMHRAEIIKESLKKKYELKAKENAIVAPPLPLMKEITNASGTQRLEKSERSEQNGHKDENFKMETELTAGDLNFMLKKKEGSLMVIDIRDSNLFAASHLICENIINIPGERLSERHLSVSAIESILDPAFVSRWNIRHLFDTVVIVDTEGHQSKTIRDLINVLTEYSSTPVKNRPLLLTGGFYGLIAKFPQCTSDPYHRVPRQDVPKSRIADIRYPSVSIFNDLPDPVSPEVPRKTPQTVEKPTENGSFDSSVDFKAEKRFSRRPNSGTYFETEPIPSVIPVSFRPGTREDSDTTQLRSVPSQPMVNRQTKPTASGSSTGGILAATSVSTNSFADVISNPNVTTRRGSMEIRTEFSEEQLKKPSEVPASKFVPEVPRFFKPTVANGSIENGQAAPSGGSLFKDVGENFRKIRERSPSPLPITGRQSDSQNTKEKVLPVVRNIPIVVEKRTAPQDLPPEIQRVLKPRHNLPVAQYLLPPAPSPHLLEPSLPFGSEKKLGYTGLKNLGNTCYMNAVLQCLSHTKPIREYYKTGQYKEDVSFHNPLGTRGKMSVYMAELMKHLWSGNYKYFSPVFMKDFLAEQHSEFRGNDQQDANDALMLIVNRLHEDTNKAKLVGADDSTRRRLSKIENQENLSPTELVPATIKMYKLLRDSLINSYMSFLVENIVTCCRCGHESYTHTYDQMLNVWHGPEYERLSARPPRAHLMDMLTSSMQAGNEQIDRKCEECGFQGATKRHCFNTVPRILAIQLTRFNPDRSKDDQFVHFDHTLSLEVFCKQPAVAGTAKYRLYAVLNHFGDLNSGHYTASVLHCDTGKDWLKCDDQNVSRMSVKDVVTSNAYILFYEQIAHMTSPY